MLTFRTPMRSRSRLHLLALALTMVVSTQAAANIVLFGTRVIYPEGQREVSVRMNNRGEQPALVQAWVDRGDTTATPDKADAPFVITPPISRVEPGKGQTLRLSFLGDDVPADKESLYWLNVLDIPPRPQATDGENLMQLAIRSRVKIFLRPAVLTDEGALTAPQQLQWQVKRDGNGRVQGIEATNPSAYYVNLATVDVGPEGKTVSTREGGMIAPGATHLFSFASPLPAQLEKARVSFGYITDYGGIAHGESTLGAP
ncbi:molecular chaperone [Burkholderia ubonensis]|nr:fimbria/pilus periplasmic chaperone [Burkholderia ubonensis]